MKLIDIRIELFTHNILLKLLAAVLAVAAVIVINAV